MGNHGKEGVMAVNEKELRKQLLAFLQKIT
jgi:hypothetical protein